MFKKYTFTICFLFIGLIAIHFLKNVTRELEEKIYMTSKKIRFLNKNIELQKIEFSYLSNPARIEDLAKRYLEQDYIQIFPENDYINEKK